MTLATVVYQACDEIGSPRPAANMPAATDQTTQQWLALLKRTGDVLKKRIEWSYLVTPGTITTVNAQAAYAMPADFDRFINDTQWNTANRVPLFGPMNQSNWAENEFGMINVGPFYRQQLRGTTLYLQPTPSTAGQVIGFYYISSNWVLQNGTTPGMTFAADSDTFKIDDDLLTAGLKWRWLRAKRLAYDEERDEYDRLVIKAIADDRGARKLSLDPNEELEQPKYGFVVPITGFGG